MMGEEREVSFYCGKNQVRGRGWKSARSRRQRRWDFLIKEWGAVWLVLVAWGVGCGGWGWEWARGRGSSVE